MKRLRKFGKLFNCGRRKGRFLSYIFQTLRRDQNSIFERIFQ